MDGCEILHQLVDDLSHYNPMIYSIYCTVFHSYHSLPTGARFLPSTVGFDPSLCQFPDPLTAGGAIANRVAPLPRACRWVAQE